MPRKIRSQTKDDKIDAAEPASSRVSGSNVLKSTASGGAASTSTASINSASINSAGQSSRHIELRGVRVHNLQNIDLDLPLRSLIVVTGVSGSGKSSLAFDTLYAEGQRRYIESFSSYARQYLDRMERPDADRIDNIPPAIAIRQRTARSNRRSTVATATEVQDDLRLLFARLGRVECPDCHQPVESDSPESARGILAQLPAGLRFMLGFAVADPTIADAEYFVEQGFSRAVWNGRVGTLQEFADLKKKSLPSQIYVILDRLQSGVTPQERIADSLEQAFIRGLGRCVAIVQQPTDLSQSTAPFTERIAQSPVVEIDSADWHLCEFHTQLVCRGCGTEYLVPQPRMLSYNTPLGACSECNGFGMVPSITFEKLVPDPEKTLRQGAIVPWTTPAYAHELQELLDLARDYRLPVDVPFRELTAAHRKLIMDGVPERKFGGLKGFFAWLERRRYKMHIAVLLSRYRDYAVCPGCSGKRLNRMALAVRLAGQNIADLAASNIESAIEFLNQLPAQLGEAARQAAAHVLPRVIARLEYLRDVGLGYLTLDRPLNTLSGGEAQRVTLTAALGSNLVNTLYVLDEPSIGLHPRDTQRLIAALQRLQKLGNSVVVVEHEPAMWQAADVLVEIGPGAGPNGGRVLFVGAPEELIRQSRSESHSADASTGVSSSQTADGSKSISALSPTAVALRAVVEAQRHTGKNATDPNSALRTRRTPTGRLRLSGANLNNLQNITVEFPLGVLCVVTGVSGSGKSSLVQDTLYPAAARMLKMTGDIPPVGPYDQLSGLEQIDVIRLLDQSPIGKTPRSNPATYMGLFDDIRKAFAATGDAAARGFSAGHFSFNSAAGGRCERCEGAGVLEIDMQFLPDVTMVCPECNGSRYNRSVLEIKLRGLNIAEVLRQTVREAFAYCRGMPAVQRRLKSLIDTGLEYICLGQSADTLSGGESQRMKLAEVLSSGTSERTLFVLDEPTTGLHPADVQRLLQCFDLLLQAGHSLIVVEHHLDVIRSADEVIDLGPDAGARGGRLVAQGPPESIAAVAESVTGRFI